MPDINSLISYIDARQAYENSGIGSSFVRELPPNFQDTFLDMCSFKRLRMESPDDDIVHFISGYDGFNLQGTYYATKRLMRAKAAVRYQYGIFKWSYKGDLQERTCAIPSTPLINHFKYDIYGMYGSSLFSSPMCNA
jgi:hypothetical protein